MLHGFLIGSLNSRQSSIIEMLQVLSVFSGQAVLHADFRAKEVLAVHALLRSSGSSDVPILDELLCGAGRRGADFFDITELSE